MFKTDIARTVAATRCATVFSVTCVLGAVAPATSTVQDAFTIAATGTPAVDITMTATITRIDTGTPAAGVLGSACRIS